MKIGTYSILLLALCFAQCKSANQNGSNLTEQNPSHLMVLFEEDVMPEKLAMLKDFKIADMKRTSRSQNLWMIKLEEAGDIQKLIDACSSSDQVKEVYKVDQSATSETNTNTKSGKSNPIKN